MLRPWVAFISPMATPDAINPASIAPGPEARRDSTVIGKSLSKTVTDTITGPIFRLCLCQCVLALTNRLFAAHGALLTGTGLFEVSQHWVAQVSTSIPSWATAW